MDGVWPGQDHGVIYMRLLASLLEVEECGSLEVAVRNLGELLKVI